MTTPAPPREAAPSPQTRRIVLGALALGLLFEVLNLIGTQDKPVYRAMPWHDDPYHAAVLAAVFSVAILVVAIAARMLVWSAPGGPDRAWQMVRAGGVLVAVVAIASAFQWVSVAVHAHGRAWNGATTLQIAALGVTSAAALAVALGLARARRSGRRRARPEHDWLGDAALLVAQIPALGRAATPDLVAWIRRRALLVFAGASVLAAAPIVAAQAIGESITDPVVIAWFEAVLAATLFAFCMIANALAGIVARPSRSAARRVAERSLVAACLGIQVSEAFHDQIWRALTGHPVGTVGSLVALTVGVALLAAAVCAAALLLGPRTAARWLPHRPVSDGSGGAR